MRAAGRQAAKALTEQARAMKDMVGAATEHRQADQADHARRTSEHSPGAGRVLAQLTERAPHHRAQRARGVKQTRGGTGDLLRHAEALDRRRRRLRKNGACATAGDAEPTGIGVRDRHPDRPTPISSSARWDALARAR